MDGHAQRVDQLTQLHGLSEDIRSREIVFNPHTGATYADVDVQISEFERILASRKPELEAEIEFKRARGVTAAQFAEMELAFAKFDTLRAGALEKRDVRPLLFSLGEDLTKQQVEQLVSQYGNGGRVTLAQFKQMMIGLAGLQESRDVILAAVQFVAQNRETCTLTRLKRAVSPATVSTLVLYLPLDVDGSFKLTAWALEMLQL
jgi:hypothetical protein